MKFSVIKNLTDDVIEDILKDADIMEHELSAEIKKTKDEVVINLSYPPGLNMNNNNDDEHISIGTITFRKEGKKIHVTLDSEGGHMKHLTACYEALTAALGTKKGGSRKKKRSSKNRRRTRK